MIMNNTVSDSIVERLYDNIYKTYFCKSIRKPKLNRRAIPVLGRAEFCILGNLGIITTVILPHKIKQTKKNYLLKQVIYHELMHAKYPMEGHTGKNFRKEEYNNPFRQTKTHRLSKVS